MQIYSTSLVIGSWWRSWEIGFHMTKLQGNFSVLKIDSKLLSKYYIILFWQGSDLCKGRPWGGGYGQHDQTYAVTRFDMICMI